ncbi:MAG: hypothetical protein H0T46_24410 [Deltaproteobacteria bacterium]|nr:hypothetical protein [Deltaproteobacteria bacterium]
MSRSKETTAPPPARAPAHGGGGGKGYKRSWKNLLINKRYQLQFTLFMVGLSTLLMAGLGIWVMKVANETTTVSMASVRGTPCPKIPGMIDSSANEDDVPVVPMKLPEGGAAASEPPPAPAPAEPAAGSGSDAATEDAARPRATVVMDDSTMTMLPAVKSVPPDFGAKVVGHWTCELRLTGKIKALERGRLLILWVLIGTGLLLVMGLAVYGIKMTHKVAGPLFKVGLYLTKMQQGRYDKVWNLRKGDQLVDFYDHFKTAHAGVVTMETNDIAKLEAVIAAAEQAGAGEHPTIVELRDIVARKEKAIE